MFSKLKKPERLFYGLMILVWLSNLLALWLAKEIKFSADRIVVLNLQRSLLLLIIVSLLLLVIVLLYRFLLFRLAKENRNYPLWFSAVTLVEIIVNILLTPFWLQVMYGIPFFASSAIRIIKATITINLEGIIGYGLLNLVIRLNKDQNSQENEIKQTKP